MRTWMRRSLATVLVAALLLGGTGASATEPTEEMTAPTEIVEETQAPTEAPTEIPTEAPTETPTEAPAEPVAEPHTYTVDDQSAIYGICDAMAEGMSFDQLLVYDATNDKILYTNSREGTKLYPASVTKLFSSYVALQYLDPLDVVTVGDELDLVHPGSSVAYIGRGHRLYVQTVVEAMMLPSGNDAAVVLAVAAGRKIAEDDTLAAQDAVNVFVQEMNRMAKELGFEKTHFANADGWHSGSHYTCLNDLARISKLALENKTISRYMKKHQEEVTFLSGQKLTWKNTNLLLNPEEGYYRGDAVGMKTGYTRQAEYSLMSAFKYGDGRIFVIGVFGYADEYQRFREVIQLAKACKTQLEAEAKAIG